MNDGIYIGWIYGNRKDRQELKRLGMKGHMIWRRSKKADGKHGIFEHCEADLETLDRLDKQYSAPNRSVFTFTDEKEYKKYLSQFENESSDLCLYCGGGIPSHSLKCPHCYAAPKSAY